MPDPTAALTTLRASTADLLNGLPAETWNDADVTAASLLPGWTRGHVLTHLARNAEGITATLSGALRGEIVPRYPGGDAERDAAIEAGASRPIAEQIADVVETAERLDRVLGAVADTDAWEARTDGDRTAADWVAQRLREVEIHRVDLAGGYTPDRWPPHLIAELLPTLAEGVAGRVAEPVRLRVTTSPDPDLLDRTWGEAGGREVAGPDWALLAWMVGRPQVSGLADPPALDAWR